MPCQRDDVEGDVTGVSGFTEAGEYVVTIVWSFVCHMWTFPSVEEVAR